MVKQKITAIEKKFTKALKKTEDDVIVLRLYVAGETNRSKKAIERIKKICEDYISKQGKRCVLEVIDVCKHPKLAIGDQIIATPTLIKKLPLPMRRLIGDATDTERLIIGIDVK